MMQDMLFAIYSIHDVAAILDNKSLFICSCLLWLLEQYSIKLIYLKLSQIIFVFIDFLN